MIHGVLRALLGHLETVGVAGSVDAARVVYLSSLYRGGAVFAVFHDRDVPTMVVKVESVPSRFGRLRREWATLTELSELPAVRPRVPRPISLSSVDGNLVLAQSALPGTPMNVVLRRRLAPHPARAARDHRLITDWHRLFAESDTRRPPILVEPDHVMSRIEQAAEGSSLEARDVDRWGRLASSIGPLEVPVTRVHGDLNAGNYLVHRGRLHVIDWEGGMMPAPAPTELLVSLVQYGRSTPGPHRRLLGREDSFRRSFCGSHWLARTTARTWDAEVARLGLPAEVGPYLLASTLAEIVSIGHRLDPSGARQSWQRPDWRTSLHAYLSHRPSGPSR